MNRLALTATLLSLFLLTCSNGQAAPRIAILDFELNDITSLPNTPREQLRTASLRPLLEQSLNRSGDYEMIRLTTADQADANAGFGYLFRFHALAAKLGEQSGADWVIVGQHSKPSFLFSYLLVNLIDVKKQTLATSFAIELKGNHEKVTQRAVKSLADKIDASLKQ